jgi:hypothetical protein
MKNADIIIFSGQSNMQGQSEASICKDEIKNAFEYKFLGDILAPLCDPVGENIKADGGEGYPFYDGIKLSDWLNDHLVGSSCYGNTNLVPEFCRVYCEKTENTAIAVHAAKGSTKIDYWLPGTAAYSLLVKKAKAAIKKAKESYLVRGIYFVWLQGESDAIARNTKEYYKEKINLLCDALKKDVGIDKFGVIRVGRFTKDERDLEIIAAQDEVCRESNDFLMLTDIATELNTIEKYMNPFVGGHYSAEGLKKLGHEAGTTLGEYTLKIKEN